MGMGDPAATGRAGARAAQGPRSGRVRGGDGVLAAGAGDPKLGYIPIGTRMMATEKVEHESCKNGFYGLPGGYACASKGLLVDEEKPPPMKIFPAGPAARPGSSVRIWVCAALEQPDVVADDPATQELAAMGMQRTARESERVAAKEPPTDAPIPAESGEGLPPAEAPQVESFALADVKLPLSPNTPWLRARVLSVAG